MFRRRRAVRDAATSGDTQTSGASSTTLADGTFPVTIEHAYGSTTIESQPERVATVAWGNHEVPWRSASCPWA